MTNSLSIFVVIELWGIGILASEKMNSKLKKHVRNTPTEEVSYHVCVCVDEDGGKMTLNYLVIFGFGNKTNAKNAEYCVSSWNKTHQVAVHPLPHKFQITKFWYILRDVFLAQCARTQHTHTHEHKSTSTSTSTRISNIIRNDTWIKSSIQFDKNEHIEWARRASLSLTVSLYPPRVFFYLDWNGQAVTDLCNVYQWYARSVGWLVACMTLT